MSGSQLALHFGKCSQDQFEEHPSLLAIEGCPAVQTTVDAFAFDSGHLIRIGGEDDGFEPSPAAVLGVLGFFTDMTWCDMTWCCCVLLGSH